MKVHSFHLMPYPYLPEDFRERYHSVYIDIPPDLYDPALGHQVYNDYLDELEYAAAMGFDGICVNEHHSNAYGLVPSPNLMAATLARRTQNAGLVVLGNSIALYNPPTRVAEEFAMIDAISGGRLVAGMPLGTSMDTNFAYGQAPITLRDKYHEAHDLIIKAWTEPEPFAWNGKYTQLRYVNVWPRPLQKPHPPIWIPGGSSPETWDWVVEMDYLYAHLSLSGHASARRMLGNYYSLLEKAGKEPNPYRVGMTQGCFVADSEDEAEELYSEAVAYFYEKCLHIYRGFNDAPGYRTKRAIEMGMAQSQMSTAQNAFAGGPQRPVTWKDRIESGAVIAGTPEQVTERLRSICKELGVGHLMLLMQLGSLSREKTMRNIEMMATKVLPNIRDLFDDEWEDKWWIKPVASAERAELGVK
jgi:alkanesulfonate monooxygenase SsuD/methylene tetrahydromethanopterin reductase-like flavin-dependent oxidoreductase (luciferase family)